MPRYTPDFGPEDFGGEDYPAEGTQPLGPQRIGKDTPPPRAALQGVGVLIPVEGNAWVAFRNHKGLLEVPGGKVHPGENPRWAAFRETVEETGYAPQGLRVLYRGAHVGRHGEPYEATVFLAALTSLTPTTVMELQDERGFPCVAVSAEELTGPKGQFPDVYREALAVFNRARQTR